MKKSVPILPIVLAGAPIEAALKWRFAPTTLDGKPFKLIGLLTFNFTLQ
jgi:hypothetical protein